jgi:heme-degrading monooxygenase HmoA
MVVEYIRYVVPTEQSDAFERAYEEATSVLERDEHWHAYEVSRCAEEPTRYVVRLEWDSIDGHEHGFRGGPHFGPFLEAVRPFINQIEEMRDYVPTAPVWRREP